MAIYSGSARFIMAFSSAGPLLEIRTTATHKARLLEISCSCNSAVVQFNYGIGRPAAIGVTPNQTGIFTDEGDGNGVAALTTTAIGWVTPPTVPTNFFRRQTTNPSVGNGVIWIFGRGIGIPVSGSVVLWYTAGTQGPTADVHAVIDE